MVNIKMVNNKMVNSKTVNNEMVNNKLVNTKMVNNSDNSDDVRKQRHANSKQKQNIENFHDKEDMNLFKYEVESNTDAMYK